MHRPVKRAIRKSDRNEKEGISISVRLASAGGVVTSLKFRVSNRFVQNELSENYAASSCGGVRGGRWWTLVRKSLINGVPRGIRTDRPPALARPGRAISFVFGLSCTRGLAKDSGKAAVVVVLWWSWWTGGGRKTV
jgi:hypothetical protein